MARKTLAERQFDAFMRKPLSVRKAMATIVICTLMSVFVGGALMTLLDPKEFPDLGTGLWWAVQTVTTVGYGDVTPQHVVGRLVGALFMLEAIAFVAIVTAAITSSFVTRARQERYAGAESADKIQDEWLMKQLAEITARLERIERSLESDGPTDASQHRPS